MGTNTLEPQIGATTYGKGGSINMIQECRNKLSEHELILVNNTLMFMFINGRSFAVTPFQIFLIKNNHRNYEKRLERLKDMINTGKIKTMTDLVEYNGLKPTVNSQFDGLEMIRMDLSWIN